MAVPLYSAFLGCSHDMELWLIPSVWPALCSALCANTCGCWKGSHGFVLVQQKAISTHGREYASAAENKQHTATCSVCVAYSLILYNVGVGVVSARLESVGKPCDPLTAVNRCYLTTPVSIVRSLDWNTILSCFTYLNVLGSSLLTVWTHVSQFYGKIGWELNAMVRKNERHFIRGILPSFSKHLQNKILFLLFQ